MKSLILFLTAAFAYFSTVQAYFYVPSFSNVLPFKGGMAYAKKNQSLYLFGGENATSSYTNNLYKLTQTDSSYNWEIVPQINAPNGTVYGQSYITADGNNMVVMGGMTNATAGKQAPLQIRSYNFASQTWTEPSTNTGNATAFPLNREFFSLAYDSKSQKSYVFGGAVSGAGVVFNDLQVLDANFKATTLKPTPSGRYGHTASIISTGEMVVIGGIIATNTGSGLANMDSVWVYKIDTNEWVVRNVTTTGARFPSTCSDHSAVVTSDDKIIIFGGDNGENQRNRQFLNTVAILDTKTWAWTIPSIGGIPPSRRSFAAVGLLDDKHLTVTFGAGSNVYYNDINVFDLSGSSWVQSFDQSSSSSNQTISKGLIAGVTVAGVVLLIIILFLLWKFQSYVRWLVVRIHNDIWKPRTGEPVWAETSRIASQVFFLFIFVMFLYFVIRQAVDSPNIVQRIETAAAEVDVPDVRFCFDGFPSESNTFGPPGVSCHTDNGYTCTSYVKQLNMSVFQPTFSDNLGAVNCYLFRAPDDFKLTSTSGANNGSRLLFTMFGDQSTTYGRVHVSVYPKNMDPNAKVYGYNDGISNYLKEFDVLSWQNNERNDLEATNVYTIEPFTYSALSYDIVDHRYLQPVGWNYVGFLPLTNSTPEISSTFRQEAPNPTYTSGHADLGIVAVFPNDFATLVDREVKMYTLVNALGFVGGIFGMLVAVQTWLFGFRPRSPWGVVHRWSTGSRKQSLLRGLQQKFKTSDSGIPLVHPVHHRFSVNEFQNLGQETEAQRVSRVEERMQVLELLFKAYYVDDEVFRSLDNAATIDKSGPNNASQPQFGGVTTPSTPGTTNANPFFPSSEKLSPHYQKEDQNGFSHMFNERQSRQGSISSSDAHSQVQLNAGDNVHLRDMR
ncbi:RING finger protein B [Choanephora cucurbitarum]|uniref:RING finger protein B n=1 Tax=Choanephora cucurbitarum TaxID=101091 RepID=A0A1C7NI81_9FUNG|nr:RING finger protein B [Choanephora cucurbitarum]